MRWDLLFTAAGAALLALPATPASAAGADGAARHPGRGDEVRIHRGHRGGDRPGPGAFGSDDRRHDRNIFGGFDEAFYAREYQGDTLWRSGGFNDWWHDRPDRAFPRWVGTNAKCERMWWSGSGWRC